MGYDTNRAATVIAQTKKWITDVVVGCNFCPFAGRVIKGNGVHYQVEDATQMAASLESVWEECRRLDREEAIDTTLLIFPDGFQRFDDYLDLVDLAEKWLTKNGYEGIYQIASFHPLYRFAKTAADDPANYTNRSIYPMLHLLREEQITKALSRYPAPERIPDNNMLFARQKGELYMRLLRASCLGDRAED